MAVRYSKREQTKLVNRVKKLIAQGKTVNAACTSVSEREGGQPAANTLANWLKAAGLPEAEPTQEEAAPAAEEAAPAAPKKRRRRAATRKPAPAAATPVPESEPKAPESEQNTETETPVEQSEIPVTESTAVPAAEAIGAADTQAEPLTESATAAGAELVHIRTADRTAETTGDLDDLLDENLRLRTALSEANREIRAMRDLLVVYASR
ncbi:hypothetical protein [Nocardia carnea]|uniref:Transposase n=1 Tax=Nocardia carnea TaxID=37328 RepID=A0ABW7TM27_9NOCA|nr:hypothetical protein [Nocardia carnea]